MAGAFPARHGPVSGNEPAMPNRLALWLLAATVTAGGFYVLARALQALPGALLGDWTWAAVLALLTVLTGKFNMEAPGQPATFSISEFFVFASLLLFGPAPATLAVALGGLRTSLTQHRPRWYRTVFNIAEPALGTWSAGTVYVAVMGPGPALAAVGEPRSLVAVLAMAMTFFAFSSVLSSMALGLENGVSVLRLWKRQSLYLGVHYYAAAALATLVVESGMSVVVTALVAPLLVLPYVAYRAVSTRLKESEEHTKEVERSYEATIETLAMAVDAKDHVTHGHVRRVQRHTVALARALSVTDPIEIKAIEAAALLHDIGKLAVPDHVLNKPGALSQSEFEQMKGHVHAGAAMLTAVEFPYPVVPIVRGHHEQWDGRGYPDGLAGDEIPIGARILTVVDCFDAVTSDRPYRRKLTDEDALSILRSRSGTMYDPHVVEAFEALAPSLRSDDAILDRQAQSTVTVPQTNKSLGDGRATADHQTASLFELMLVAPAALKRLTRQLPDAEACLLFLQAGTEGLTPADATPLVRSALETCTLRLGQGVSGWVAAHRYRIVNADPALDLGDVAQRLNLRSCMSVPVFSIGDLVGVLTVYLPQPRGFSPREVHLVGVLAQEIGLEVIQCATR